MSAKEFLRTLRALDPPTIFPPLDTPYSERHSTTNFAAWGPDVSAVHDIILQRQGQMSLVDEIIEHTETILSQLRWEREKIMSSKRLHENFLACVRRLPSEILKKIFFYCLPPTKYLKPNKADAPFLLTKICKKWREIAIDSPELWCSLSVPGTRKHPEKLIPLYADWLKKAKSTPLSLILDVSELYSPAWRAAALDLFKLYTNRCRELHLRFKEADCLSSFLGDFPLLERLSLDGSMTQTNMPTISVSQLQPRLRTLRISSPTFDAGMLRLFDLGWSHITHLAMVFPGNPFDRRAELFYRLLQMCPNLEHFIYSPPGDLRYSDSSNTISFTYPKLRVLILGEGYHLTAPRFLDRLTLPNLHNIQVRTSQDYQLRNDSVFHDTSGHDLPSLDEPRHRMFTFAFPTPHHCPMSLFNPGWATITHLKLQITARDIAFQVIGLCPNLEDLAIIALCTDDRYSRYGIRSPSDDPLPGPTTITHRGLRSLSLSEISGPLGLLLDAFTFPNLLHLIITLDYKEIRRWPHEAFKKFFYRSQFPLETLILNEVRKNAVVKSDFTSFIPTLKRIEVNGPMPGPKEIRISTIIDPDSEDDYDYDEDEEDDYEDEENEEDYEDYEDEIDVDM